MPYSSLKWFFIVLTSFQYILHSKEIPMKKENDEGMQLQNAKYDGAIADDYIANDNQVDSELDGKKEEQESLVSDLDSSELQIDGKRYGNKEPYCCARTKATPKWTNKCPTFDSKFGCERRVNKCKWDLCSKVGYCQATGVNAGSFDQIDNLCSRQTNKANCVNKITDGSKNCEWIYGYPPITTSPPPENVEFVNINNMTHTTSNISFYSIEFVALVLFLVSISFIAYKSCCINEYKSADMVLMEMTHIGETKGLLSQI